MGSCIDNNLPYVAASLLDEWNMATDKNDKNSLTNKNDKFIALDIFSIAKTWALKYSS